MAAIRICLVVMSGKLRSNLLRSVNECTWVVVRILMSMFRSKSELLIPWVFCRKGIRVPLPSMIGMSGVHG